MCRNKWNRSKEQAQALIQLNCLHLPATGQGTCQGWLPEGRWVRIVPHLASSTPGTVLENCIVGSALLARE